MIPKRKNALFVCLFMLVNYAVLTAVAPASSPTLPGFNASLKDAGGKSTTERLANSDCRLLIKDFAANHHSLIHNHQSPITKVVIDAGHGGKDPGGMGANSQEKHIALRIAQLLSIGIRTNFPDVEVIMTRNDDTFIPLYERADIANKAGADLFISIHANIMPGSSATKGTETFVMGQHVAQHNLDVAKRENASILLEGGDVKANYGFDPNSNEGHIMMSMFQHAFLERSISFAELVEKEFATAGRKSRGVKQAGFVVLKATTMPAVLVETGFMSNPTEEAYLLSDAGQRRLANGLLRAFSAYHQQLGGGAQVVTELAERVQGTVAKQATRQLKDISRAPASTTRASVFGKEIDLKTTPPPTPARQQQWTAKGVDEQPLTYQSKPSVYNYIPPVPTSAVPAPPPAIRQTSVLRRQVTPPPSPAATPDRVVPGYTPSPASYGTPLSQPATGNRQLATGTRQPAPGNRYQATVDTVPYAFNQAKVKKVKGVDLKQVADSQLLYAVQIAATSKAIDAKASPYRGLPYPLHHFREGGLNKYQVRNLPNAATAKAAKARLKELGFFDAMIVVYLDGKRLGAEQVRYLLGR